MQRPANPARRLNKKEESARRFGVPVSAQFQLCMASQPLLGVSAACLRLAVRTFKLEGHLSLLQGFQQPVLDQQCFSCRPAAPVPIETFAALEGMDGLGSVCDLDNSVDGAFARPASRVEAASPCKFAV